VLELMSGTGRLSIPLARAGAVLTCVDISEGMLSVLERKLGEERLQAAVVRADVQYMNFEQEFDVAILPFQSFMELVGTPKQMNALRSVHRALVHNGRFYCTMHNPVIRRASVDGVLRGAGAFPCGQGTVVVSGFEDGGHPVVRRCRFIERFDESGRLAVRLLQLMELEMIEGNEFRRMAMDAGFKVHAVHGDYEAGAFDAETSPVMIWELHKKEA